MGSPFARAVDRLRADPVLNGKTFPHLDGIRGMAVLMILVRHCWGLSGESAAVVHIPGIGAYSLAPFIDMMSSGIDLFFVLSAFLLSQQFLRADFLGQGKPSLRRYYRTRFLRIFPPYWVVLALTLLLFTPYLIPVSAVYSTHGLVAVFLHAVLLQTVWFGSYGVWNLGSAFWTLTIEILFYAVLPWIMPLFYRNRAFWLGLPSCLLVTVGWLALVRGGLGPFVHVVAGHSHPYNAWVGIFPGSPAHGAAAMGAVRYWLSQQIPASAFDFAVGIAMANLVVRRHLDVPHDRRLTSPAAGTTYAVVGVVLTLLAMWRLGVPAIAHQYYFGTSIVTSDASGYFYYFLNQLPFALSYGLLIGGVTLGASALRRAFSISGLALIGILGYSIYLIHMQFLYLFNTFPSIFFSSSPRTHFVKLFFSAGPVILLCALGLYLAVERPFIYRSRSVARPPRHAAVPGPVPTPIPEVPAASVESRTA